MLNVLVTGAGGQLGSELRTAAAGSADNYIFTDIAELDITDAAAVARMVRECGADVIVNCAAYTDVERAETQPDAAMLLNRDAVGFMAAAAAECGALMIHISTDYVFGSGTHNTPFAEEDAVAPSCVYGAAKLAGERAVAESGCRHIIFRTSWLYSPFGRNFVNTMLSLTASRDSVSVVFDQTGTPTRAAGLARLIFRIIDSRLFDGREGIYHYSDEGVCSWYDFAVEIARLAGSKCRVEPCRSAEFTSRVARPAYSVLDKSRVKRVFGIEIPHWRDSLAEHFRELNQSPCGGK
ncbi:MAG: dTDP-4-dehydrorhamnose reductase [Alistipes sp.]|nr:dTDP-4-dehydrorhamnose reductase [Alistipes sp.]